MKPWLFIIVLCALAVSGAAADYENSLTVKLVQDRSPGGAVWLGSGRHTFLSLYREAPQPGTNNAVIILHSMGMHADWPQLISPLRTQLPERGWTTLSVQLPVLSPDTGIAEYGETFPNANRRLRTSIRFLLDRGYENIVIAGLGFGATTAVQYLAGQGSVVKGLIGIGMQNHVFLKPKYNLVENLSNIKQPVLDIYASEDSTGVLESIDDRRLAGNNKQNKLYNQVVINGTTRYYTGRETELVDRIINWLDRTFPADHKKDI